jgi:hypothetical protein
VCHLLAFPVSANAHVAAMHFPHHTHSQRALVYLPAIGIRFTTSQPQSSTPPPPQEYLWQHPWPFYPPPPLPFLGTLLWCLGLFGVLKRALDPDPDPRWAMHRAEWVYYNAGARIILQR